MTNKFLIQVLAILVIVVTGACSKMYYNNAELAYKNKEYKKAVHQYEKLDKLQNNTYDVNRQMAHAYYEVKNYTEAEKYYEKAIIDYPKDAKLFYQLALVMKMNGKCAEGSMYFKQYAMLAHGMGDYSEALNYFCDEETSQAELYDVAKVNLPVGKTYINPIEHAGRIYFLTKMKDNLEYDIYSVKADDLSDFKALQGNVNTIYAEGPFDFDPITGDLYFTKQKEGFDDLLANKDYVVQLEIWKAKKEGEKWKITEPFAYNYENYSVGQPSISSDGQLLVFVSDKSPSVGQTDLFYCVRKEDGNWGTPQVFGADVNSAYKELIPNLALSEDGKEYILTFASDRLGGFGGTDIYATVFDGESWSRTLHYEYPINSSANEYSLRYNNKKNGTFLTSDREGKHLTDDVYEFSYKNAVRGVLKTSDGILLTNEKLKITNVSSGEEHEVFTNEKGEYQAHIKPGFEYKIETFSDKISPLLVELSSNFEIVPVYYNLDLIAAYNGAYIPDEISKEIIMQKVYFKNNSFELNKALSTDLIKLKNTLLKYKGVSINIIGHTDSRGSKKYNLELSEKRAKEVHNWLGLNGINPNRLKYEGRGESELVNVCSDGINCEEKYHAENRRTTFAIIKNELTEK